VAGLPSHALPLTLLLPIPFHPQVVQPGQLEALPFKPPTFPQHLVQIFLATIQVGVRKWAMCCCNMAAAAAAAHWPHGHAFMLEPALSLG
jgi:hypothetical protein